MRARIRIVRRLLTLDLGASPILELKHDWFLSFSVEAISGDEHMHVKGLVTHLWHRDQLKFRHFVSRTNCESRGGMGQEYAKDGPT